VENLDLIVLSVLSVHGLNVIPLFSISPFVRSMSAFIALRLKAVLNLAAFVELINTFFSLALVTEFGSVRCHLE
jgi:hypothetical protein